MSDLPEKNPWHALRSFTHARIALGRARSSLPTAPLLAFNLAHAQARDAVHCSLDTRLINEQLAPIGLETVSVWSAASHRHLYLQRPDLGRRLSDESRHVLMNLSQKKREVVFVIADGLSALAASRHAALLLNEIRPLLEGWEIGPIVVAQQARVALGDEIGQILQAEIVVMLIGERPGLSSPDSLGIYLTYSPQVGRSDAERNCISNVRPEGLSYAAAAHKLHYLLTHARRLKMTGVELKEGCEVLNLHDHFITL